MSLWQPEVIHCVVGERCVALSDAKGQVLTTRALVWSPEMPEARKAQVLSEALTEALAEQRQVQGIRARCVRAMAAEAWGRYWVMRAPPATRSFEELRAVALTRCQQLLGAATGWAVAGDWKADEPFLCCALPAWLTTSIRQVLGEGVAVATPVGALLQKPPKAMRKNLDSWACFSSPRRLVMLAWKQGRLAQILSLAVNEDESTEARMRRAAQEIRRAQLRGSLQLEGEIPWWSWPGAHTESVSVSLGSFTFVVGAQSQTVGLSWPEALEPELKTALLVTLGDQQQATEWTANA